MTVYTTWIIPFSFVASQCGTGDAAPPVSSPGCKARRRGLGCSEHPAVAALQPPAPLRSWQGPACPLRWFAVLDVLVVPVREVLLNVILGQPASASAPMFVCIYQTALRMEENDMLFHEEDAGLWEQFADIWFVKARKKIGVAWCKSCQVSLVYIHPA